MQNALEAAKNTGDPMDGMYLASNTANSAGETMIAQPLIPYG
jgi:hypothetical protein